MMKKIFFITVFFLLPLAGILAQSTSLSGYVKIEETGEALSSATVILYQKKQFVKETKTDSLGYYKLDNLEPGTYNIEVDWPRCSVKSFANIQIFAGKSIKLDIELLPKSIWMDEVTVIAYKIPKFKIPIIGCSIASGYIQKIPVLKMRVSANPPASQPSLDALVVQETVGCGRYYKEAFSAVYSLTAAQIRLSCIKKVVENLSR